VTGPVDNPADRRLLPALRTMTAPLWLGQAARTSFAVAPGRLVTFGTEVLFRDGAGEHYPCLCGAVEPGDELWALGYPRGDETQATVVGLRARNHTAPQQLELVFGEPGAGSTGGPVLNWRTGSVCGLLLVTDDTGLWLVPIPPTGSADRAWLALMDDAQILASGQRYPGADLRKYLADIRQPAATYLPQHLYHESDGTHVTVEALADRHEGAQVLGDPGVGKSSLVRHLAADSATRWLAGEVGEFVPIPLSARALAASGPLPRLLADGVTREVATMIDTPALMTMFERAPMPGVPWLVLVDGLDEVQNEFDRRLVLERVLGHRDRELYRFLVTSRPPGLGAFDRLAQPYPTYVLEPFDDGDLARFARTRFTDAGHHDVDRMVTGFMAEVARSGLGRLARVPLMSMMLCTAFPEGVDSLPRGQCEVYERFFAVLARKPETSGTRLVTGLPALLEEIACAQQGLGVILDNRPILAQAVERSRPDAPRAIPADTWAELVAEALRASGLLVHRKSDFRFLHQTIGEYLAARRLAARAGGAERRALLAPRTQWPWPHLEITIFVAALWISRGIDLTAQFTRLLKGSHRDTNVGFLVELGRRGIPLPAHIRVRVGDILAARLHSGRTTASESVAATRWLRDLDPSRAVDELARLVCQHPGWGRAMDAVTELTTLDPVRGTELAPTVACDEAHSPDKRLILAKRVLAADRTTGVEVLRTLAKSPSMGTLAVDAASLLADEDRSSGTELLGWLATSRWSSEVTLAACWALLRWEQDGIVELDRVWRSVSVDFGGRLALTDQIAQVSRGAAEWRYQDLVDAKDAPTDIRFAAAQGMTRLNVESGVPALRLLTEIAEDQRLAGRERIAAADRVLPIDEPFALALYLRISANSKDAESRIEAALKAGDIDRREGIAALADLALSGSMDRHLHDIALAAIRVDAEMAVVQWRYLPKDAREAMRRVTG
jgi:hypothetical protein